MMTLELDGDMEQFLEEYAKESGESRENVIKQALLTLKEDYEDYKQAVEIEKQGNRRYTLEEVERELGMAD